MSSYRPCEQFKGKKSYLFFYYLSGMVESIAPLASYQSSDVLDMPVDPNEPTYCLCHQVSYGEMIGCDNQDVSTHNTVQR